MKLYTMMLRLLNASPDTSSVADKVEEGLNWHPEKALETLDNMGIGMLVIFVIIGVIILSTMLVNKIFSKK